MRVEPVPVGDQRAEAAALHQRQPDPVGRQESPHRSVLHPGIEPEEVLLNGERLHRADEEAGRQIAGHQPAHDRPDLPHDGQDFRLVDGDCVGYHPQHDQRDHEQADHADPVLVAVREGVVDRQFGGERFPKVERHQSGNEDVGKHRKSGQQALQKEGIADSQSDDDGECGEHGDS